MKIKQGFTIIENIAVLVIVGALVVLSLPHLINYNSNINKQIKVRKAVTNYQVILTKELLHATGIRNTEEFNEYLSSDNYSSIVDRFNTKSKNCGSSNCNFITDDGVTWNVTQPSMAVISLSDTDTPSLGLAADTNNKNVFYIPYEVINGRLKLLLSSNTANNQVQTAIYKTRSFIND